MSKAEVLASLTDALEACQKIMVQTGMTGVPRCHIRNWKVNYNLGAAVAGLIAAGTFLSEELKEDTKK